VAVLRRGQLWVVLGVVAAGGMSCPGVAFRPGDNPGEEKCPAGAKEAMEAFNLAPGDDVPLYVDATRRDPGPLILYDGPIESMTWGNMQDLPGPVRLHGRVWTGGPRVVIRYYSARLPDGRVIPFCATATWNGPGLPKSPGRSGSAAIQNLEASVTITGQFK